jgi:hypothetical protein
MRNPGRQSAGPGSGVVFRYSLSNLGVVEVVHESGDFAMTDQGGQERTVRYWRCLYDAHTGLHLGIERVRGRYV